MTRIAQAHLAEVGDQRDEGGGIRLAGEHVARPAHRTDRAADAGPRALLVVRGEPGGARERGRTQLVGERGDHGGVHRRRRTAGTTARAASRAGRAGERTPNPRATSTASVRIVSSIPANQGSGEPAAQRAADRARAPGAGRRDERHAERGVGIPRRNVERDEAAEGVADEPPRRVPEGARHLDDGIRHVLDAAHTIEAAALAPAGQIERDDVGERRGRPRSDAAISGVQVVHEPAAPCSRIVAGPPASRPRARRPRRPRSGRRAGAGRARRRRCGAGAGAGAGSRWLFVAAAGTVLPPARRLPWKGDPRHRHLGRHRRRGGRRRRRRAGRRREREPARPRRGDRRAAAGGAGRGIRCAGRGQALTHVAAGMGPGPFTGLRVGIAAARAFALGRGIPVVPVVSHDAVALEVFLARRADRHRRRAVRGRDRCAPPRVRVHGVRRDRRRRTARARDRARAHSARRARRAARRTRRRAPRRRGGVGRDGRDRRRPRASPPAACSASTEPLYLRSPDVTLPHGPEAGHRMSDPRSADASPTSTRSWRSSARRSPATPGRTR